MKYRKFLFVSLVFLLVCTLPVMGVTTYLGGSPKMSAAISGVNEFAPGEDAVITVVVLNSGVSSMKNAWVGGSNPVVVTTRPDHSTDFKDDQYAVWQGSGTIARDDIPMTAKMVTVGLSPGNAPVIIKSDPQNVGDIATQSTRTVKISAKITANATEGEYQLPLSIKYTYLADSNQPAADLLQSDYQTTTEIIPLTIRVQPQVKIDVIEATADNLSVGTGGFITLKIKNLGLEDGKKATVRLLRSGKSPIIPADSSVFIGDFPRDSVVTCRYKVSISTDAEKQTYPIDIAVTYENHEGDIVTTSSETIGIPVGGKVTFAALPESNTVTPGDEQVVVIRYQNTGEFPVYSAQARLSAVDPFTSSDNTAYLGDLKPGETATARYTISTKGDAGVKEYALDTEVRYRDALDNSQISDTFKVPVKVVDKPASARDPGTAACISRPDCGRRRVLFTCNANEEVMLGWDGELPPAGARTISEMRPVLANPSCHCDDPLYFMYRDLAKSDADRHWLQSHNLRYDLTVIPPRDLCGEWVKTKGHYHPNNAAGVGYPEIYEVLEGRAHYLLQSRSLTDVVMIDAHAGDHVIIPRATGI